MKYFLILAFCLTAVFAEDLDQRPCFHCIHYSQHQQTVEEAKQQISDVVGADAQFETVGSYGAAGNVAEANSFGAQSEANLNAESSFGSNSGASFGAESGSSFGAESGASFGAESGASFGAQSGSSFGAQSGASFGAQSSYGVNSASNFGASSTLESNNNFDAVGSGFVVPVEAGSSAAGYVEHAQNVQAVAPVVYGGSSGSESLVQQSSQRVHVAPVVTYPSVGSESYVRHEERRVENQAAPVITYQAPASGFESYLKYRKVVQQSQPQVVALNTLSSNSQLGSLVSGALTTGAAQNVNSGYTNKYQSGFGGYGAANSQQHFGSGFHSGSSFGAQQNVASFAQQNAALQAAQQNAASFSVRQNAAFQAAQQQQAALHAAQQQAASFAAQQSALLAARQQAAFNAQQNFGYNTNSAFKSGFGASSNFAASNNLAAASNLGASSSFGSSSGLHSYISEAERLAKEQAQSLSTGGVRTGGSVLSEGGFNAGVDAGLVGGYNNAAVANGGYKTKSWEKASKWSSKSESDSNGNVNNYKEISTGESEQYDINGNRVGFKAATSTLDDNGKVSSYSLHT